MPSLPTRQLPLLLVFMAICAALGLGLGERWYSRQGTNAGPDAAGLATTTTGQARGAPQLSEQAVLYPAPRELQPFVLQSANDQPLGNADLVGHWTVAFLGFTNCPDVCPTALATLREMEKLNLAGGNAKLSLEYWFVSVDPERDTPAVLREYAAYFSPSIVAATAPADDIEGFARDVGVVFLKVPQKAGDYTIDHSMQILLIDPEGRLQAMWRPPHAAPVMLDDIARIAASRSRA